MSLKELILIFAVMLIVLVLAGTGYASASPPDEEWNRTYEMSGITSVESFQQTADSRLWLHNCRKYEIKCSLCVKDRSNGVRAME